MKKLLIGICFLTGTLLNVNAQEGHFLQIYDEAIPEKANKELQFIAYFYSQAVRSNYYPTNDFLRGQVVGRLFGQNTTNTSDTSSTFYMEQRLLPFFIYTPRLFDGKVILRTSFEIDWTWGDVAYGVGGNTGSGISADQVNIQTQNVELELIPFKNWAINLGLQRMYDTPHNPYRTFVDKMTKTGYRLTYWGTDGVGITIRHDGDFHDLKAGYYQLYENNIHENDDVTLTELNYQKNLSLRWNVGGSFYYVRDRGNGEGGPSILGQGLNSTLTNYNGVYRFPLGGSPYKADVMWLGAYFGYNEDFMAAPLLLTGFVNYNFGTVQTFTDDWRQAATIGGIGANLRAGYRYGQTEEDAVLVDLIMTTGDNNNLSDEKYSGVITGNTWGTPASLYISHGGYILFPHGNVVNRFVSAVNDISNIGYGLAGGTFNAHRGIIPNKLNAKVGGAAAWSQVAPGGGGQFVGVEANGRVSYSFGPYMSLELHGAYLWLGDFYDSPLVNGNVAERPDNPWTAFLGFKWLMF